MIKRYLFLLEISDSQRIPILPRDYFDKYLIVKGYLFLLEIILINIKRYLFFLEIILISIR